MPTGSTAEAKEVKLGTSSGNSDGNVKTFGAKLASELAAAQPITGVPITQGKAALPDGTKIAFDSKSRKLSVTIGGKTESRVIDNGGVTTIVPLFAFALAAPSRVAVSLAFHGDVVRTHALQLFAPSGTTAGPAAQPRATGAGCVYAGKPRAQNERFTATDGCNTCVCNGSAVECTEETCPKPK